MSTFDARKLQDRYLNDPEFYAAVRAMEAMIRDHGFTMLELRQAAFFACYKYEMQNPIVISQPGAAK